MRLGRRNDAAHFGIVNEIENVRETGMRSGLHRRLLFPLADAVRSFLNQVLHEVCSRRLELFHMFEEVMKLLARIGARNADENVRLGSQNGVDMRSETGRKLRGRGLVEEIAR